MSGYGMLLMYRDVQPQSVAALSGPAAEIGTKRFLTQSGHWRF